MKYSRTPSIQDKLDTHALLRMLKLDKCDELALKYWQSGLSNDCKSQIKST
jgi:hypothetical protein